MLENSCQSNITRNTNEQVERHPLLYALNAVMVLTKICG